MNSAGVQQVVNITGVLNHSLQRGGSLETSGGGGVGAEGGVTAVRGEVGRLVTLTGCEVRDWE